MYALVAFKTGVGGTPGLLRPYAIAVAPNPD
jgi:hypothetical protein